MARRRGNRGKGCIVAFLMLCIVTVGIILVGSHFLKRTDLLTHVIKDAEKPVRPVEFQEVTITEESLSNKYYYSKLNAGEQLVYKEIAQGIREHQPEIYVHTDQAENANRIFRFVLYDMPDIFWCDGKATTTGYEGRAGKEGYAILQVAYTYDKETAKAKAAAIKTAVTECLSGIDQGAEEYEKIKYVYDYVVRTVDYDPAAPDNQNICSVFLEKRSVCAGYARAFQYLLEQMNLYVTYVTGTSTGGLSGTRAEHAWNLVRCGGEYYYVDATWGDPVFTNQETEEALQNFSVINYDYLLTNEEQLFLTHTLSAEVDMPPCNSNTYNYYILNGMYYDSLDEEMLLGAMNQVVDAQENPVIYKFADQDLYVQGRELIMNKLIERSAQRFMKKYGKEEVNYYYQEEELLNKLTIFWVYE